MKPKFGRCRSCGIKVWPVEKFAGIVYQCYEHPTTEVVDWPGVMTCAYRYVSEAAANGIEVAEFVERFDVTQYVGTDRASMALAALFYADWGVLPELRVAGGRFARPDGLYGNG